MESIGEKIRGLRRRAGLSQVQLAELVDRNPHTIKDYEAGRVIPSWEATVKIAEALGVAQKDLLSEALPETARKEISAQELAKFINQIISLGPTEIEILKETLDSLTKPLQKKSARKEG